jgi:transglutaminase-like putative cysteine protease
MPIFAIRHVTAYRYRQPVAFGEHRMMLRPRDDGDQIVLETAIDIAPQPHRLSWTRDGYGNHVATARFAQPDSELRFESTSRLSHEPADFCPADIADFARNYPFEQAPADKPTVSRPSSPSQLDRWATRFLRADGSADTHELLVGMTQAIKQTFKHVARHEKGIQDPLDTLTRASGSCRDHAMLMMAGLRSLGLAARFVSGYLYLPDDDDPCVTGGNTHAWVQAYIPGPGWVDFDPSSGTSGNQNLVRVAVVDDPSEAIPLQGSWTGAAADHLSMKVAVKVAAAPQ